MITFYYNISFLTFLTTLLRLKPYIPRKLLILAVTNQGCGYQNGVALCLTGESGPPALMCFQHA